MVLVKNPSSGHMLILRGKDGRKIFDYIKNNATQIPYARLEAESKAFKEKLRAGKAE